MTFPLPPLFVMILSACSGAPSHPPAESTPIHTSAGAVATPRRPDVPEPSVPATPDSATISPFYRSLLDGPDFDLEVTYEERQQRDNRRHRADGSFTLQCTTLPLARRATLAAVSIDCDVDRIETHGTIEAAGLAFGFLERCFVATDSGLYMLDEVVPEYLEEPEYIDVPPLLTAEPEAVELEWQGDEDSIYSSILRCSDLPADHPLRGLSGCTSDLWCADWRRRPGNDREDMTVCFESGRGMRFLAIDTESHWMGRATRLVAQVR